MNKTCARCEKTVYPTEELKCLDKVWHKGCFKCQECGMTLNMKTYKGYGKLPYCESHVPKAKHTTMAETPELKRIAENTKIQSNVKYHADFEKSKGKFTQVADDPETLRIKANTKIISNVAYHGDLEKKAMMEKQRQINENGEIVEVSSTDNYHQQIENYATEMLPPNVPPPNLPQKTHYQTPQTQQTQNQDYYKSKYDNNDYSYSQYNNQYSNSNKNTTQYNHTTQTHSNTQYTSVPQNAYTNNSQQYSTQYTNPSQNHPIPSQPPIPQQQHSIPSQQHSIPSQQHSIPPQQHSIPSKQHSIPSQQHPISSQQHSNPSQYTSGQYQNSQQKYDEYQYTYGQYQQQNYGVGQQQKIGRIQDYDPVSDGPRVPPSTQRASTTLIYNSTNDGRPKGSHQQASQNRNIGRVTDLDPLSEDISSNANNNGQRVYIAMYDYEANDSDEVSFCEGDLISNVTSIDSGWMTGQVLRTGRTGMLPANYVEHYRN